MLMSRTELAYAAVDKAAALRDRFDVEPQHAVNVFDICAEKLDPRITVRFKDISMEGVYLHEEREIWLGLRPLTRRVFNCAHELGHHVFKHGSTLDELQDKKNEQLFKPEEYLANTFAAYLLMPRIAVMFAYSVRGWKPEQTTPEQCFVVSSSLGVGYETLVHQLSHGLHLVSDPVAEALLKVRLPSIRGSLLGVHASKRLQVIDRHYTLPVMDTEVGTSIMFPVGSHSEQTTLRHVADSVSDSLFLAESPGITRVTTEDGWGVMVRIMRYQYVGLSRYRNLEPENDEDE